MVDGLLRDLATRVVRKRSEVHGALKCLEPTQQDS